MKILTNLDVVLTSIFRGIHGDSQAMQAPLGVLLLALSVQQYPGQPTLISTVSRCLLIRLQWLRLVMMIGHGDMDMMEIVS